MRYFKQKFYGETNIFEYKHNTNLSSMFPPLSESSYRFFSGVVHQSNEVWVGIPCFWEKQNAHINKYQDLA